MEPHCRWKHSFAESRQCYLFSLFPRGRCQGKREWFSQFSFYFVDIIRMEKSNFEKPFESCQMALLKKGLGLPMFVYK